MKVPLQAKVGALLLSQAFVTLIGVVTVAAYLRSSRSESAFVGVAGRQRMLAASLGEWAALTITRGEAMPESAQELDLALGVLRNGGVLHGLKLDPAPDALLPSLDALALTWLQVRADVMLAASASLTETRLAAAERARNGLPAVRAAAEALVARALEHGREERSRLTMRLWACFGVSLLVLVVGLIATWRRMVQPIAELEAAARRMQQGDLSARVPHPGDDELGALAAAFGAMASSLDGAMKELEAGRARAEALLAAEREANARANESRARFEDVFAHCTDGMVLADKTGCITHFNRAAEAMFGWSREEVVGKPVTMLMPAAYWQAHERGWERVASNAAPPVPRVHAFECATREGNPLLVECTISVQRTAGELTVLAVIRDVTTQRAMADRLMQVDRMAAVGTLAAGVAHEVNNPLAFLLSSVNFVATALPTVLPERGDELVNEVRGALEDANEGAVRIRDIVRDLQTFSRGSTAEPRPTDLRAALHWATRMAEGHLRGHAKLVREFGPMPLVNGNSTRLGQVFLNLLINAAHAVEERAEDEAEVRVITRTTPDGEAVIEVHDTGPGVPAHLLPRIFDPFVSTRPEGHGTGLGLSICRNIVADLGGSITAANRTDGGAVFTVRLPGAREGDEREPQRV